MDDVSIPTKCIFTQSSQPGASQLKHIAAGGNHTLILFESGEVFAAGSNENGRCAHGSNTVPSLLEFNSVKIPVDESGTNSQNINIGNEHGETISRFSAVSATWEASFFVSLDRKTIYVSGAGGKGELGLGEGVTEACGPVKMADFPPAGAEIACISSSMGHTAAVLSNGEIYGWGNARKGQLGDDGVKDKIFWSPRRVVATGDDGLKAVTGLEVACGREFTVITAENNEGGGEKSIRILGSNKWEILSTAPRSVRGYKVLGASWHGVYIHRSDGAVLAWGRNDRGQIPPSDSPTLTGFAAGSEHAVGVLDNGRLVACGWGEHGNCGPDTDTKGNVAGRWSEIPTSLEQDSVISSVGAGCATSWVSVSSKSLP